MRNHHRTLRIFLTFIIFLIAGNSRAQSFDGVFAGSIGTSITFPPREIDCITKDPHYTEFWDFGPGATPAKDTTPGIFDGLISVHFPQVVVTYSTPGDKTFTLTLDSSGGSSNTGTYALHIFDCSVPSIPHDAIVINSDTTATLFSTLEPSKTYWVNPGVVLNLYTTYGHDSSITIFAEPGSTISGNLAYCRLFMKHGSAFTSTLGSNSVIFGDGANIKAASNGTSDFTLQCPTLDFDYSNAPPNAAQPSSSVKNDLSSVPMTLFPNPTGGMLSVQGLPSDNITVSVFNIIGETVMLQKNPPSPDFTLDLSKLVPGTYYIRFSSANSVVTKKIIKN